MRRIASALCLLLSLGALASAETDSPQSGENPLERYLFPPEKVIAHSQEISLDEAQRNGIREDVHKAQGKFLDLQFDLQTEGEKLARLLQEKPIDETKVLAQIDRILTLEREVKKTQVSLLVRIKNLLTPAQQAKLTEILRAEK